MSLSDLVGLVQAAAMVLTAALALLAWLESRKTTAKVVQTHDLVNSQSAQLLKVSQGVAYREGVEHADATDSAQLSADLKQAESQTKIANGEEK
jgi:hypothetical protein